MTGAEKPPQIVMKEGLEIIVENGRATAELASSIHTTLISTDEKVAKILEQQQDAARETVAALASKLATMIPTAPPSGDMALLLADCRDTITEGIGALHSQSADVLHALQILQAPPAKVPPPKYSWWVTGVAGLVAGLVLMGATWWVWPDGGYRAFIVGLDAALVKHYPQLPSAVQDAVTAVYGRHQFQTPGSRQKGK